MAICCTCAIQGTLKFPQLETPERQSQQRVRVIAGDSQIIRQALDRC
jgi:hypothetical protein